MASYQLLRGAHVQTDKDGRERRYFHSDPANNIVESDVELDKRFGPQKFKRVDFSSESLGDGLDRLNVKELRQYAEDEEIDLGEARKKAELIEAIREALAVRE